MFVFAAASGQLDNRRGLLEHLAAAVHHKVVVSGDFGEGDGMCVLQATHIDLVPAPPRTAFFKISHVAKRGTVPKHRATGP